MCRRTGVESHSVDHSQGETSSYSSSPHSRLLLRPYDNSYSAVVKFMLDEYPRMVVVVLEFYVLPTVKVIRRPDLGLKSHPKDWRSPGSNSKPLD